MRAPLYFIALLPPEEIQREVTAFKQYIADHWGPRHAFTSPPHITLHPPFAWTNAQLPDLQQCLKNFAAGQRSFYLHLKNFAAFAPRVLFVHPEKSPELERLFRQLLLELEASLGISDPRHHSRPFQAHMTIAHRDVSEQDFPAIWAHFKAQTYDRIFRAEALTLLKHQSGQWQEFQTFRFGT